MPLPKEHIYTAEDYWNLPEGERAELIGGKLYAMAPPMRIHQKISTYLAHDILTHIQSKKKTCEVYTAPFAVNLHADDTTYVEPDIAVICDKNKLTDRGCTGAPDMVVEIVSPSSRRIDYYTKHNLYAEAGVREYWIVDPVKERTTVYYYEKEEIPAIYTFDMSITVGIFPELSITIANFLNE
ncbi:MAG: Uma2 family endonuclease [Eubacteriales bacterium]|nr:Uma2 family endonuclease [Eubacteriales bacterium]